MSEPTPPAPADPLVAILYLSALAFFVFAVVRFRNG